MKCELWLPVVLTTTKPSLLGLIIIIIQRRNSHHTAISICSAISTKKRLLIGLKILKFGLDEKLHGSDPPPPNEEVEKENKPENLPTVQKRI